MPTSFFRGEVIVGSKRHLIFMTDEQLALLKTAVRWYADGIFKIINFPFTQLFSLHGFLKKNGQLKQVLLCFVFMSGRTQRDYRKVFEKILELLDGECAVKEFSYFRNCKACSGLKIENSKCLHLKKTK